MRDADQVPLDSAERTLEGEPKEFSAKRHEKDIIYITLYPNNLAVVAGKHQKDRFRRCIDVICSVFDGGIGVVGSFARCFINSQNYQCLLS